MMAMSSSDIEYVIIYASLALMFLASPRRIYLYVADILARSF